MVICDEVRGYNSVWFMMVCMSLTLLWRWSCFWRFLFIGVNGSNRLVLSLWVIMMLRCMNFLLGVQPIYNVICFVVSILTVSIRLVQRLGYYIYSCSPRLMTNNVGSGSTKIKNKKIMLVLEFLLSSSFII